MPSQSQIQQTILNGQYALAVLVNNNYNLVASGDLGIRQKFYQWFRLNLQALIDQYGIADYTSTNTTIIYDRINQWVGIPYGETVNPNYQNPGIVIDVTNPFAPLLLVRDEGDLIDADPPNENWYLPFLYDNNSPIVNGGVPVSVIVNGVSLSGWTFDETVVPARIYGFPNNDTQTILVTVLNGSAAPTPPPPATQAINWSWFATDPYATIDTATFLFNGTTPVNPTSITVDFTNTASGQWVALKELATNTPKTTWYNTLFNSGPIPDIAMRDGIVIGLYRFYVSRTPIFFATGQTSITYAT